MKDVRKFLFAFLAGNFVASLLFGLTAAYLIDVDPYDFLGVQAFGPLNQFLVFFVGYFIVYILALVRWFLVPRLWVCKEGMKAREAFVMPFSLFFISSVIGACILVGIEWQQDQPLLRYSVITVLFALGIPALFLFFRIADGPKSADESEIEPVEGGNG